MWMAKYSFGGEGAYDMAVFGICKSFGRYFGNSNKKWSVFVFLTPESDCKIQFLIVNTKVAVFLPKCAYRIAVIFEKIDGNTVI